jgi:adenylyltransferase/sulfurtransferase
MRDDRFGRQVLLAQVGQTGQARLEGARVVVIGVGALGSVVAELLGRAGVGRRGGELVLVDRDVVELSNLQRQLLFAAEDVGVPKAAAAERRLRTIDPGLSVRAVVSDLSSVNVAEMVEGADVIVEATDNAQARFLVNDIAVKSGKPWVYGGAIGAEGRVAGFRPGKQGGGGCLRCVFRTPPSPGELGTCDTVGVFNAATTIVGAWQAQVALRMLLEPEWVPQHLLSLDVWTLRVTTLSLGEGQDPACPCCAGGKYEFLDAPPPPAVSLCGRDTVQVLPPVMLGGRGLDLAEVERRWQVLGGVRRTPFLLKLDAPEIAATLFPDGRLLLHGLKEPASARAWYDKLVGS